MGEQPGQGNLRTHAGQSLGVRADAHMLVLRSSGGPTSLGFRLLGLGGQSLGPGVATPSDFATCGFRHWVLRRMCGAGGLDVRQCDNEPPLLESQAS